MLLFIPILTLRIFQPPRDQSKSSITAKDDTICGEFSGEYYENQQYSSFFKKCDTENSKLTFTNSKFLCITTNNGQYMIQSSKSELKMEKCTFESNTFTKNMIYSNEQTVWLLSNTISNCYLADNNIESETAVINVSSLTYDCHLEDNSISFADHLHSCRAVFTFSNGNFIWKRDRITNAKSMDGLKGSAFHFYSRYRQTDTCEISDITFTNCYAGDKSILFVNFFNDDNSNIDKKISFVDTIVENTKEDASGNVESYFLYFKCSANLMHLSFINCAFRGLKSDVAKSIVKNERSGTFLFENSVFESIDLDSDSKCGVIVIDPANEATFRNCTFDKINVKNGNIIQVSQNNNDAHCIVDDCNFIECKINEYVVESAIKQFSFINSKIEFDTINNDIKGGAISIKMWNYNYFKLQICKYE